jgi:hypothetical protein
VKIVFEPEDYEAIRAALFDCEIDPLPTDQQIADVLANHRRSRELIAGGYEWGWGDTEVRESLGAVFGP